MLRYNLVEQRLLGQTYTSCTALPASHDMTQPVSPDLYELTTCCRVRVRCAALALERAETVLLYCGAGFREVVELAGKRMSDVWFSCVPWASVTLSHLYSRRLHFFLGKPHHPHPIVLGVAEEMPTRQLR
eukprot:4654889-Amphidinium_carterae.1